MAKKRFYPGMLAILLIFGMTLVSCDDDDGDSSGSGGSSGSYDAGLNGTWVNDTRDDPDDRGGYQEWILNNGNFTINSTKWDDIVRPYQKGTYTTKDGKITMTLTHIYNDGEEKWYSQAEFKDSHYDSTFRPVTCDYSLSADGKTLTLTSTYYDEKEGETVTVVVFTRKS